MRRRNRNEPNLPQSFSLPALSSRKTPLLHKPGSRLPWLPGFLYPIAGHERSSL